MQSLLRLAGPLRGVPRAAPSALAPSLSRFAAPLRAPLTAQFQRAQSTRAQKVEDVVAHRAEYVQVPPQDVRPLKEAAGLYARIHIHNWNLLVTPGDLIKLPVAMHDVEVGSVLRFSECSEIGSRNHVLSGGAAGSGRIDPASFTIRGVVVEKSRVKRAVKERTRARRRHVRHTVSNNCLTVIRVSEVTLN